MFWRRKGEFDDLEQGLRYRGPEPSDDLVQSVADGLQGRRRKAFSTGRLGLAAALTLTLVVTAAALGGFSHSASAARDVGTFFQTGSFSSKSAPHPSSTPSKAESKPKHSNSPADDEYGEKVTICHRTHANVLGNTLHLPPSGAANHLEHHQYDYPGPCHS